MIGEQVPYRADDGTIRQCLLVAENVSTSTNTEDIGTTTIGWSDTYTARDATSNNLITVQPMPGLWTQTSPWCPPVLIEEPKPKRLKGIGW